MAALLRRRRRLRVGPAHRSQLARRLGRLSGAALAAFLLVGGAFGASPSAARAPGNASAAAGFIESAQNHDGGFGEKRGQHSSPSASLWAAVALLAAGKNPGDEAVKNGASLDEYLAAHASAYGSLEQLGLLAMVQSAAQGSSSYDDPAARLESRLSESAASAAPAGAALAILGLLAVNTSAARQSATAAAQTLLASHTSDGGWGSEGLSDSASTALVLQALAASGVARANSPAVRAGIAYLHEAQANDGSIAASIRTDQAIASGSVSATAFTIQALAALDEPTLRTPTGKSVLEGLTSYQQQGTGGLTSDGSLYSQIPPSVTETAEAFAAFDGISFPLASVALLPPTASGGGSRSHGSRRSDHVSSGSAAQGVSASSGAATDAGAFNGAKVAGVAASSTHAKAGAAAARPGQRRNAPASRRAGASSPAGTSAVSGEVVGDSKPAKLVSVAGQASGGLTAAAKATLLLVALLLGSALLGGYLDARRPRADGRSLAAVGVAGTARFLASARARGALLPFAVLLVGVGLVVFPFATGMFDRTPKGARMIKAFEPYMRPSRLASYDLDVRQLREGFGEAEARAAALLSPHAPAAAARRALEASEPQLTQFESEWPRVEGTLTSLLGTIQANRGNYEAAAALPRFTLFPWFLIVPGAILIALAAGALAAPSAWGKLRWAVVALGLALIVAPLAFQMFTRAPKGAQLVRAFRSVETRGLVTGIQNDFATITTGEGAVSGELVPALEARGLSATQIDSRLPAVALLERRWVGILQDLTPLIGVMSDNVANYQAVAALPAFGLFPWLFLLSGVLVVALAVLGATRARPRIRRRVRAAEPQAA
jgi:hypothetical protein